ncbi:MAG: glycosyltransferase family 4 protein [Bacteroidia bacterium]
MDKKKTKIIIYTRSFFPTIGGLEFMALVMAEELEKMKDFEIKLLAFTEKKTGVDNYSFEIERCPSLSRTIKLFQSSDLVISFNMSNHLILPLFLSQKTELFVSQHGLISDSKISMNPLIFFKSWYANRIVKKNLCCSSFIAGHYRNSEVLLNCYDDSIFKITNFKNRSKDIVFIGRLVSDKGCDILLDALSLLKNLNLSVTIIGEGPDLEILKNIVSTNLLENVIFLGFKKGIELSDILNEHKIIVVPSNWDEPFGIVSLEGIACGCIPVVSNRGGLPEAVGQLGYKYESTNKIQLAQIIEKITSRYLKNITVLCLLEKIILANSPKIFKKTPKYNKFLPSIKQNQLYKLASIITLSVIIVSSAGGLRKWVINSAIVDRLFLLIQFIIPFVVGFSIKKRPHLLNLVILFYSILLVLMALNPLNHTIYHGILGIIIHLGFWYAMLSYWQNDNVFELSNAQILTMFSVAVVQLVLAPIQFLSPPNSFINKYVGTDESSGVAATLGSGDDLFIRVTGTFSYLSGYTSFMIFLAFFIWFLLLHGKTKLWIIVSLIVFGTIANFMSGARSGTAYFLLISLFGIFYTLKFQKLLIAIIATGIIGIYISTTPLYKKAMFIQKSYEAFSNRVKWGNKSGESKKRLSVGLTEVLNYRGSFPIFGSGLGGTYQGATGIWGESYIVKSYPGGYEEEAERTIIEGGFVLYLFKLFLFTLFVRYSKLPILFKIPFVFLLLTNFNLAFNIYNSIFLFCGLILVENELRKKTLDSENLRIA